MLYPFPFIWDLHDRNASSSVKYTDENASMSKKPLVNYKNCVPGCPPTNLGCPPTVRHNNIMVFTLIENVNSKKVSYLLGLEKIYDDPTKDLNIKSKLKTYLRSFKKNKCFKIEYNFCICLLKFFTLYFSRARRL